MSVHRIWGIAYRLEGFLTCFFWGEIPYKLGVLVGRMLFYSALTAIYKPQAGTSWVDLGDIAFAQIRTGL